jgi:tRNA A-37 threonylcarbamoyl transferase component Bud32
MVGQRVGTYRLMRLIGAGATGRVFEVEHLTIGRRAAMKILVPEHAARPGAIPRLFREARAISKINHPHIVDVTDWVEAEHAGGINAIVMELLEGQSLAQAIQQDKHMAPARFLPILAQVADALSAAHEARFVHRDLKPENIYLTHHGPADYVKLLDFGLVKTVTENAGHATAEGIFVGTPAYASPEQASGRPVDHRTDIYSLGVILYELLCGRLPFEGRNFGEFLVKHLTEPPPPTPPEVLRTELGRTLDGIARRCLAKDPEQRYASAAEVRDLLQRLVAGRNLPLVSALRARGRTRWLLAGAASALLLAGMLVLHPAARRPAPPVTPGPALARAPKVVPLASAETVILDFTSDPAGAETRVAGNPQLLGQTPFRRTETASGGEVVYEMRLPGYAPRRDRVLLSPGPQQVGGPLKKLPAPARPHVRSPGARNKPSRNETLNPFTP